MQWIIYLCMMRILCKKIWHDSKQIQTRVVLTHLFFGPGNHKSHIGFGWLVVLGFNNTSTLVGHYVSSPKEREKRDRKDSRGDEREGQERKRNRNESEETEMKVKKQKK